MVALLTVAAVEQEALGDLESAVGSYLASREAVSSEVASVYGFADLAVVTPDCPARDGSDSGCST